MGWDWKTGMISDCDELQKNQAQNDPLTVKTPPPCTGSPPAWWIQGGRWRAHCLRLILRRRRSLPPAPMPCFPIRGRSPAGQEAPKSLAAQGFLANAEKVQIPALTEGQAGRRWRRWARSSRPRRWGKGFPWCLCPFSPSPLLPF